MFDLGNTSPSYCIGILGMPGATAYFGLQLLDAKPGETLVLNGAAGAVGSAIGQLAKIRVIQEQSNCLIHKVTVIITGSKSDRIRRKR